MLLIISRLLLSDCFEVAYLDSFDEMVLFSVLRFKPSICAFSHSANPRTCIPLSSGPDWLVGIDETHKEEIKHVQNTDKRIEYDSSHQ